MIDLGGRPGIHEVFCREVTAILHGPCFARALFVIDIHLAEEEALCQIYEATDLEGSRVATVTLRFILVNSPRQTTRLTTAVY